MVELPPSGRSVSPPRTGPFFFACVRWSGRGSPFQPQAVIGGVPVRRWGAPRTHPGAPPASIRAAPEQTPERAAGHSRR
ncbi:hypothetical protein GCM10027162_43340 [Streptomyces incanus]